VFWSLVSFPNLALLSKFVYRAPFSVSVFPTTCFVFPFRAQGNGILRTGCRRQALFTFPFAPFPCGRKKGPRLSLCFSFFSSKTTVGEAGAPPSKLKNGFYYFSAFFFLPRAIDISLPGHKNFSLVGVSLLAPGHPFFSVICLYIRLHVHFFCSSFPNGSSESIAFFLYRRAFFVNPFCKNFVAVSAIEPPLRFQANFLSFFDQVIDGSFFHPSSALFFFSWGLQLVFINFPSRISRMIRDSSVLIRLFLPRRGA